MRISLFYHSLLSDWNHGNAHFLRGIVTDLINRGYEVQVFEPHDSWSLANLIQDHGYGPVDEFRSNYPKLSTCRYSIETFDLSQALDQSDLVLVHEWNTPEIVKEIGLHRSQGGSYQLLFHDTHHRMVTQFEEMSRYDLQHYDGVLAFGKTIQDLYLSTGLAQRAWTWHEAADTEVFYPRKPLELEGDLIWIGNWGDEERTEELHEFLIGPSLELGLKTRIHGVRYPETAQKALKDTGIDYRGWLPNFKAPEMFSRFKFTVHIPRRPYVQALAGIPTIRVFEALACGIPLISAPWEDTENLFNPGRDYLVARNGSEMRKFMAQLIQDQDLADHLRRNGLDTIQKRHTCRHRVDELLTIYNELTRGEV